MPAPEVCAGRVNVNAASAPTFMGLAANVGDVLNVVCPSAATTNAVVAPALIVKTPFPPGLCVHPAGHAGPGSVVPSRSHVGTYAPTVQVPPPAVQAADVVWSFFRLHVPASPVAVPVHVAAPPAPDPSVNAPPAPPAPPVTTTAPPAWFASAAPPATATAPPTPLVLAPAVTATAPPAPLALAPAVSDAAPPAPAAGPAPPTTDTAPPAPAPRPAPAVIVTSPPAVSVPPAA